MSNLKLLLVIPPYIFSQINNISINEYIHYNLTYEYVGISNTTYNIDVVGGIVITKGYW